MNYAAVDFETFYSAEVSITIQGVEGYILHPQFHVYQVAIVTSTGLEWVGDPSDPLCPWDQISGPDWEWLAHNASFDERVHYYLKLWCRIPSTAEPKLWHCTADLCAYSAAPRALAGAAAFLYKEKVSKDYRGVMKGVLFSSLAPDKQELVREAGLIDARRCLKFWNDLSPNWPESERRLSRLSREQGWRGVRTDAERITDHIEHLKALIWTAELKLPWANTGTPLSYPMLCEECRKAGVEAPASIAKTDEACAEWEEKYGDRFPWIDAMRVVRSANALLKKLETMRDRTRPSDGRMPFANKYWGAHCFTGDAEVLTRTGWQRLDEWGGGDIVQWENGKLGFYPATANAFDVQNGERLLRLVSPYVRATMTQGHWLLTYRRNGDSLSEKQAQELRSVARDIPVSGLFEGGSIKVPRWKITLFAAVQADGHYLKDYRAIRFRFKKMRKIARLRQCLDQSKLDWSEQTFPSEPGVTTFIIRQFPDWLGDRKHWNDELLRWTLGSLTVLREELIHWDGCLSGKRSIEYSTCDKSDAEWISLVAHLTGWAASTRVRSRDPKWAVNYRVTLRPHAKTRLCPKHWSDAGAAEKVFCPTAQKGVCLFRQDGTIFITKQTGRWSDGGGEGRSQDSGFNTRNLPHGEMFGEDWFLGKKNKDGTREDAKGHNYIHLWSPETSRGVDLRKCLIPAEGHHFTPADLSQIEPRILWSFAGDHAALDLVRTGMSPYEAHARATMNYMLDLPMDEGDPAGYRLAKARVLALGYQAGWVRFITMARIYKVEACFDHPITEEDKARFTNYLQKCRVAEWLALWSRADENTRRTYVNSWLIVSGFRATNPLIIKLWRKLDRAVRNAIGEDFEIKLPSGRALKYRNIAMDDGNVTGVVIKNGKPTRIKLYGGLLTENITQATARDVFAECLLRLDDAKLWVPLSIHDEAVPEVPLATTANEVKLIMSQPPDWMPNLPVGSKCQSVLYYTKT